VQGDEAAGFTGEFCRAERRRHSKGGRVARAPSPPRPKLQGLYRVPSGYAFAAQRNEMRYPMEKMLVTNKGD
jgi:hypothetical protein